MRFKQFLEEAEEQRRPTSTASSKEEVLAWIRNNAKHYVSALFDDDSRAIYRGMGSHDDFALGDSNTFRRKASNTTNEVQSLIATSSKWKDYPSRESAYICSSMSSTGRSYGQASEGSAYLVIPADKARIGICPDGDFWSCFDEGFKGVELVDVSDVNASIMFMRKATKLKLPDDNPAQLRKELSSLTVEDVRAAADADSSAMYNFAESYLMSIADYMEEHGIKTLLDWIEHALDPKVNKFEHCLAEDYPGAERAEVWIQGKVAFIKIEHDIEEVREMLKEIWK